MKKTALFLATLLIAARMGFAGDNPVVGTWESDTGQGMKIYSETHFSLVSGRMEDRQGREARL